MADLSKISVILPSLDPDEKLHAVVEGLLDVGFTHIILVNDGSKPENLHYFLEEAEAHPEITLLQHEVNRGKGAALKTAFRWFLENRPDAFGVITVDGDNQHHKLDTKACAEHLLETGHLTLGVRDFDQDDVPPRSRFGNKATSAVFKIFVGMTVSDTQTGLRAISSKDLKVLLDVEGDRFEYETNMLLALKRFNTPYDEVKIRTVYIEENKTSHFHPIRDSWRIYKLILVHFFRFTLISIVSSFIEILLYALLSWLFATFRLFAGVALTSACTMIARVLSSLFNFFMNKKVVFQSDASTGKAMVRYYILVLVQMLAQIVLTQGLYMLFRVPDSATVMHTLIYTIVMIVLYIPSFMIQQRWVFAPKEKEKECV